MKRAINPDKKNKKHKGQKKKKFFSCYRRQNPYDADDDIEALGLVLVVLEAPHAVLLVVPVGARGRMHAAASHRGGFGGRGRWGGGGFCVFVTGR